jgi:putative redox protein
MAKITAELTNGTEVSITNGHHTWAADEPVDKGGEDTGPTPYDQLLGALAACTCITVALYCRHKELPLKSISIHSEHKRVHADDCADCEESDKGFIEQISSEISITGEFTDAQRKRLAQIVGRCPVHKTLAGAVSLVEQVEFAN